MEQLNKLSAVWYPKDIHNIGPDSLNNIILANKK